MKITFKKVLAALILLILCLSIAPQLFHKNWGISESKGDYNGGSMENGYLLPRKGANFACYSWLSYYVLGREYIHSKIYNTVLKSYADLGKIHPERMFVYMEAARRKGGRLYPQNGLSIDFMSPLVKKNGEPKYYKWLGIFRYALNFDEEGKSKLNSEVSIDFELIAQHILILNKNARKHGLKIKKVIFNINLKNKLYQTESGKKLKKSGIYLAQNLTPLLNKLHDDHYHLDFEVIDK